MKNAFFTLFALLSITMALSCTKEGGNEIKETAASRELARSCEAVKTFIENNSWDYGDIRRHLAGDDAVKNVSEVDGYLFIDLKKGGRIIIDGNGYTNMSDPLTFSVDETPYVSPYAALLGEDSEGGEAHDEESSLQTKADGDAGGSDVFTYYRDTFKGALYWCPFGKDTFHVTIRYTDTGKVKEVHYEVDEYEKLFECYGLHDKLIYGEGVADGIGALKNFDKYSLVIVATHGSPDGGVCIPEGKIPVLEKLLSPAKNVKVADVLKEEELRWLLPKLDKTVIWNIMCYGGSDGAFLKVCKEKKVVDYFGPDKICGMSGPLEEFHSLASLMTSPDFGWDSEAAFNQRVTHSHTETEEGTNKKFSYDYLRRGPRSFIFDWCSVAAQEQQDRLNQQAGEDAKVALFKKGKIIGKQSTKAGSGTSGGQQIVIRVTGNSTGSIGYIPVDDRSIADSRTVPISETASVMEYVVRLGALDENESYTVQACLCENGIYTPLGISVQINTEADDIRSQLIKFYHDTGGPNWLYNDNWCTDKPIEEWYGVDVDENGYVRLELDNNILCGKACLKSKRLRYMDVSTSYTLSFASNKLTSLDVSGCTSLESLICYTNPLTSLDVSGCTSLEELACSGNQQLTSLDVSGLTKLEKLYCSRNQLPMLDVSGCTSLKILDCSENQRTTLDVSGLTKLEELYCSGNQLTTLNVSCLTRLAKLDCSGNQLTTLDVSGLSRLTYLRCSANQLISLNLSGCTSQYWYWFDCSGNQLTSLDVSGLSSLYYHLSCSNNQLSSLDVSGLTKLEELICTGNQLTTLDVSGLSRLKKLDCTGNQLTTLVVSGCTSLTQLDCSQNQLTSLDASCLKSLYLLHCTNNQLTSLDVSGLTRLNDFSFGNNPLTTLDVSGCTSLEGLYVYEPLTSLVGVSGCTSLYSMYFGNTQLTTLDVSGCTSLKGLTCSNNDELTSLDVSGCTSLTRLDLRQNHQLTTLDASGCTSLTELNLDWCCRWLTSLNVSGCTSLTELDCDGLYASEGGWCTHQLITLDASGCTSLTRLDFRNHQLTTLDVSGCTSLTELICSNNQLSSLDVSGLTFLKKLDCRENPIAQMITTFEDSLQGFYYDKMFSYRSDGTWEYAKSDHTGWYYPGEPEKGYHGR